MFLIFVCNCLKQLIKVDHPVDIESARFERVIYSDSDMLVTVASLSCKRLSTSRISITCKLFNYIDFF